MHFTRHLLQTVISLLALSMALRGDDTKDFFKPPKDDKPKPPAGKAEMLRHMPKKFAAFLYANSDLGTRQVTLQIEGEKQPQTWPMNADAEIKIHGWWGRLDQFRKGDRVWVWFQVDRDRKPKSILMLADEISEQDIHGRPHTLEAADLPKQAITVKPATGPSRKLPLALEIDYDTDHLKPGDRVFMQTNGENVRLVMDVRALESLRILQKKTLRDRWMQEGLPGTVVFVHSLAGEMEFMLDHEAIRWGRSLKNGDKVTLMSTKPIEAAVKEVRPWRERTQLRLVADGFAQTDLSLGQRLLLKMPTPPPEVDDSEYPPDMDRPRTKQDQIEWLLASTYCSCNIGGDNCTGMFYTLASCNVHGCGMPNYIRGKVAAFIDKGLTDKQILDELKKTQGPLMMKQHLLP